MLDLKTFALSYGQVLPSFFGDGSKCYFHTTENIKEFMEQHSPKDKNVLCVAGSGDQRLNAYFFGARKVTCFDINSLTKHQLELSQGKIMALNYQELCDFSLNEEDRYYYFQKIAPYLSPDTRKLYQAVFQNNQTNFYYPAVSTLGKLERINAYFKEDDYESFQDEIRGKEISFLKSDIKDLRYRLQEEKYDMILLSNLNDTIDTIFDSNLSELEQLKEYRKIVRGLSKQLTDDGIMQVGYSYAAHPKRKRTAFDDTHLREQIFTPEEYKTEKVTSYDSYGKEDTIVVYQKKKRSH